MGFVPDLSRFFSRCIDTAKSQGIQAVILIGSVFVVLCQLKVCDDVVVSDK